MQGLLVWLLALLLLLPCGGAVDLCACAEGEHGQSCAPPAPQPTKSCCSREPAPKEHPERCPGCPELELPELPTSVAPSWSDDAQPTAPALALAPILAAPCAAPRAAPVDAWPPPDPVPLYLSLSVLRL